MLAWAKALRPGGALGISWNTFVARRGDAAQALAASGLHVMDSGPYLNFRHRVDQAIMRDIIVAASLSEVGGTGSRWHFDRAFMPSHQARASRIRASAICQVTAGPGLMVSMSGLMWRFLWECNVTVLRWARWARTEVEAWPDDLSQVDVTSEFSRTVSAASRPGPAHDARCRLLEQS